MKKPSRSLLVIVFIYVLGSGLFTCSFSPWLLHFEEVLNDSELLRIVDFQSSPQPLWNHTFGGGENDWGLAVVECSDGGFAILGQTESFTEGEMNVWLIRVDDDGDLLWNRTFGGSDYDSAGSLIECSTGGFAIVGTTQSYASGIYSDVWLIRTDDSGNLQWNRTYSDPDYHLAGRAIVEVSTGGFAIAGWRRESTDYPWDYRMMLLRTDASGTRLWERSYGGELPEDIIECSDGGFAIVGAEKFTTISDEEDYDMYLVHTDADGDWDWWNKWGEPDSDAYGYSVVECSDGGFALAGIWDATGGTGVFTRVESGSSTSDLFEGGGTSVIEVSSGGFALTGYRSGDLLLIRYSSTSGSSLWDRTYNGGQNERGNALIECSDGSFAIVGVTSSYGVGKKDVWLVRIPDYIPSPTSTPSSSPTAIPGFQSVAIVLGLSVALSIGILVRRRKGSILN